MNAEHPEREKSEIIANIPRVCSDESAAVEFFELQRWGDSPCCPYCQGKDVYKMTARDGARNKRFLWRCRGCGEQYTVRIGAIYEESRLPMKVWAFAFWRASTSKKGVSALEIQRQCQVSYKTALYLMHRVRFAVTVTPPKDSKLGGVLEIDETYCGGKPPRTLDGEVRLKRIEGKGYRKDSNKTPVVAMVQRGGNVRTKVVPNVTQKNVAQFIQENVANGSVVNTDQSRIYHTILYPIIKHGGRHDIVNHKDCEYSRLNPDGTVSGINHAESFFSLLKRGLMGIFHAVSKEHLHRYCNEFAFRWDTRRLNDGERVVEAIKRSEGKRLMYKDYVCRKGNH